jgi:hypothetical protein
MAAREAGHRHLLSALRGSSHLEEHGPAARLVILAPAQELRLAEATLVPRQVRESSDFHWRLRRDPDNPGSPHREHPQQSQVVVDHRS